MTIFWLIIIFIAVSFFFVIFFGAPYLPILSKSSKEAIEILKLKPNQTIIDLGCGGGKLLREAARNNLKAVGYELNPILFFIAYLSTRKWSKNTKVIYGNFWKKDLVKADAIFVFLLPKYMVKLDAKISDYRYKPVKLISYAFSIPDKKPKLSKNNLFVYEYTKHN